MIGFAAIIFRNRAFHKDPAVYARLVKLVLFSSAVHQAVFVTVSSLPFAVGQVRKRKESTKQCLCAFSLSRREENTHRSRPSTKPSLSRFRHSHSLWGRYAETKKENAEPCLIASHMKFYNT